MEYHKQSDGLRYFFIFPLIVCASGGILLNSANYEQYGTDRTHGLVKKDYEGFRASNYRKLVWKNLQRKNADRPSKATFNFKGDSWKSDVDGVTIDKSGQSDTFVEIYRRQDANKLKSLDPVKKSANKGDVGKHFRIKRDATLNTTVKNDTSYFDKNESVLTTTSDKKTPTKVPLIFYNSTVQNVTHLQQFSEIIANSQRQEASSTVGTSTTRTTTASVFPSTINLVPLLNVSETSGLDKTSADLSASKQTLSVTTPTVLEDVMSPVTTTAVLESSTITVPEPVLTQSVPKSTNGTSSSLSTNTINETKSSFTSQSPTSPLFVEQTTSDILSTSSSHTVNNNTTVTTSPRTDTTHLVTSAEPAPSSSSPLESALITGSDTSTLLSSILSSLNSSSLPVDTTIKSSTTKSPPETISPSTTVITSQTPTNNSFHEVSITHKPKEVTFVNSVTNPSNSATTSVLHDESSSKTQHSTKVSTPFYKTPIPEVQTSPTDKQSSVQKNTSSTEVTSSSTEGTPLQSMLNISLEPVSQTEKAQQITTSNISSLFVSTTPQVLSSEASHELSSPESSEKTASEFVTVPGTSTSDKIPASPADPESTPEPSASTSSFALLPEPDVSTVVNLSSTLQPNSVSSAPTSEPTTLTRMTSTNTNSSFLKSTVAEPTPELPTSTSHGKSSDCKEGGLCLASETKSSFFTNSEISTSTVASTSNQTAERPSSNQNVSTRMTSLSTNVTDLSTPVTSDKVEGDTAETVTLIQHVTISALPSLPDINVSLPHVDDSETSTMKIRTPSVSDYVTLEPTTVVLVKSTPEPASVSGQKITTTEPKTEPETHSTVIPLKSTAEPMSVPSQKITPTEPKTEPETHTTIVPARSTPEHASVPDQQKTTPEPKTEPQTPDPETWPEQMTPWLTDANANTTVSPSGMPPKAEPSDIAFAEPGPDWEVAFPLWKGAWEVHIYMIGSMFFILAIYMFISIVRLLRIPRLLSRPYFLTLNFLIFFTCSVRAFYLLYGRYNAEKQFHVAVNYFLYSIGFPCLTATFSILFYALLQATKMRFLSPNVQRLPVLITIIVFHFLFSIVTDIFVGQFASSHVLLFICQLIFVTWGFFLFIGYIFIFRRLYLSAKNRQRAMQQVVSSSKGSLRSKLTLSLGIKVTMLAAVFGFLIVVLEVYAMADVYNVFSTKIPEPWPWFIFESCLRLTEWFMCLTMAYVASQPFRGKKTNTHGWRFYFTSCTKMINCSSPKEEQEQQFTNVKESISMSECRQNSAEIPKPISGTTKLKNKIKQLNFLEKRRAEKAPKMSKSKSPNKSMLVVEEGFIRFRREDEMSEAGNSESTSSSGKVNDPLQYANSNGNVTNKCYSNGIINNGYSNTFDANRKVGCYSHRNSVSSDDLFHGPSSLNLAASIEWELDKTIYGKKRTDPDGISLHSTYSSPMEGYDKKHRFCSSTPQTILKQYSKFEAHNDNSSKTSEKYFRSQSTLSLKSTSSEHSVFLKKDKGNLVRCQSENPDRLPMRTMNSVKYYSLTDLEEQVRDSESDDSEDHLRVVEELRRFSIVSQNLNKVLGLSGRSSTDHSCSDISVNSRVQFIEGSKDEEQSFC